MRTTTTPVLLLAAVAVPAATSRCADLDAPEGTAATPETAIAPEAAPRTEPHAGYVPGDRIDAYAVNCKLCDEWRLNAANRRKISYAWDILGPGDPVWINHLMRAAEGWERLKAEHGPNSDQALLARDGLVRLRRNAVVWAEGQPGDESRTEVVDLVEGILKRK